VNPTRRERQPRTRSRTLGTRYTLREVERLRAETAVFEQLIPTAHIVRPRTRGECVEASRPCPFVSCRYHLYLDVTPAGGLKLNYPLAEPWDLAETCVLDVADRGAATLEDVGASLNITRERVRQIEDAAVLKLSRPSTLKALIDYRDHESAQPISTLSEAGLENE